MEFIQLKCPNCQATLDAEDTLDTIFCKYCGARIVIADQSKDIIEAKTRLKMADKQLEMEKERNRHAEEQRKSSDKRLHLWLTLFIGTMALLACILFAQELGWIPEIV